MTTKAQKRKRGRAARPKLPEVKERDFGPLNEIIESARKAASSGPVGKAGKSNEFVPPPSRLDGWDKDIDASKWHMVVRKSDGFIVKSVPAHVQGTLRGEVPSDCKLVEVDEPSPEQKQLYRSLNGKVKGRAVVPFDLRARDKVQTEIVDGQTSSMLAQGFSYKGIVVSLSARAIAKYTAAAARAGSLQYPYLFSSIDNLQSVELANVDEMVAFTNAVLDYYLKTLAQGDQAKTQATA